MRSLPGSLAAGVDLSVSVGEKTDVGVAVRRRDS